MTTPTTAIDPICGMTVDIATAKHKSEYKGQTYYFCAPGCKRTFEANPEQYIGASGTQDASGSHH
jgi:YHS domain-containing protein